MCIRNVLKVLSYSNEPFSGRQEAGRLLGAHLMYLVDDSPVVIGIPKGGIVTAREIARAVSGELDVALFEKLCVQGHNELVIGVVSEEGKLLAQDGHAAKNSGNGNYIFREKELKIVEIERRKSLYRGICPKIRIEGREVIIADDGIVTGSTMKSALRCIRQENPKRIIVAVPVAVSESLDMLADEADQIVCLRLPYIFRGLNGFYTQFDTIDEPNALKLLKSETAG